MIQAKPWTRLSGSHTKNCFVEQVRERASVKETYVKCTLIAKKCGVQMASCSTLNVEHLMYIIDHHIEDAATVSIRAIDLNRDLRSRTSSSGAKFAVFLKNRFGTRLSFRRETIFPVLYLPTSIPEGAKNFCKTSSSSSA